MSDALTSENVRYFKILLVNFCVTFLPKKFFSSNRQCERFHTPIAIYIQCVYASYFGKQSITIFIQNCILFCHKFSHINIHLSDTERKFSTKITEILQTTAAGFLVLDALGATSHFHGMLRVLCLSYHTSFRFISLFSLHTSQ